MGKKKEIPAYLYYKDPYSMFAMISSDLFTSPQFQDLSNAAKIFYVICAAHKQTAEQRQCLYNSLKEYFSLLGEDIAEVDLQQMAGTLPRSRKASTFFVIPQSHLEQYGLSAAYASKLKRELIDKGFIRVFANEKKHAKGNIQGANRDFSKRVTIYEFVNTWKR